MPIEIDISDLTDADQAACQAFNCGDERWAEEVNDYIQRKFWLPGRQREHALIAYVSHTDEMYGFGTWKHVDSGDGPVIRICFFGVHVAFQGERTPEGDNVADVLYATLEDDARAHRDSSDEMQLELFCDTENERGLRFWGRHGYVSIDTKHRYFQMRRN